MKNNCSFLAVLLLASCVPVSKMTVTNVNNVSSIPGSTCIYALPLSTFAVSVEALQESYTPGPFNGYAKKYLGISDVNTKAHDIWTVTSIKISPYSEMDPDFIFSIEGGNMNPSLEKIEELHREKLVLLPGDFAASQVFENTHSLISSEIPFTDLSVKPNFVVEKGSLISEILPDSSFLKLPSSKGKDTPEVKSTEQKAEEAANFIIKIRKRRFKLISGQYEFMPDGEALGRAVDELNRIEAAYVSLFIGQREVTSYTRTFQFVPAEGEDHARTILFRFSDSEGFLETGDAIGKPVFIDIQDKNSTKGLSAFQLNSKTPDNLIIYRIPDQGYMKVLFGEQVIQEATYPVNQFGALVGVKVGK